MAGRKLSIALLATAATGVTLMSAPTASAELDPTPLACAVAAPKVTKNSNGNLVARVTLPSGCRAGTWKLTIGWHRTGPWWQNIGQDRHHTDEGRTYTVITGCIQGERTYRSGLEGPGFLSVSAHSHITC